ncbi:15597_t:CDS:2, partial [Funneliformis geosporum]
MRTSKKRAIEKIEATNNTNKRVAPSDHYDNNDNSQSKSTSFKQSYKKSRKKQMHHNLHHNDGDDCPNDEEAAEATVEIGISSQVQNDLNKATPSRKLSAYDSSQVLNDFIPSSRMAPSKMLLTRDARFNSQISNCFTPLNRSVNRMYLQEHPNDGVFISPIGSIAITVQE